MTNTPEIAELVKRLEIMSGMLRMCEPIAFGTDADLMVEAATDLKRLEAEKAELIKKIDHLCGYPFCACDKTKCEVLDDPVPGKSTRDEMAATISRLREALSEVMQRACRYWPDSAHLFDQGFIDQWGRFYQRDKEDRLRPLTKLEQHLECLRRLGLSVKGEN